jgi:uncharacterized repeat protein (TIGR03806 family)
VLSRWLLAVLAITITFTTSEGAEATPRQTPWTSSRVHGIPDPPPPLRAVRVFPKLTFSMPTEIVAVPGTNYLAVADREGKIFAFSNDPNVAAADLMIDLGETVFAIAFHPRFETNGYMYVVIERARPKTIQVSRLLVERKEHWRCSPASETSIFRWRGGVHGGGALRFGPDGMLYIGTGDGSGSEDRLETGQDISDLHGSILRIDVDHPMPYKRYGIPRDNPFVGYRGARPEVWAYGLRQPWKMHFDPVTGELWLGEVGQDSWESVHLIERGGNYGWSIREGSHPYRPDRRRGPTPIQDPVVEHPHSECRALIGGVVYRGSRLPDLQGAYIYGDYETGTIWGVRVKDRKIVWHRELAHTRLKVVGFGEDAAGEVYVLDFLGGGVHRLEPADQTSHNRAFPRRLSETGLFSSVRDHRPAPGVVPYSVNASLWSDGAAKDRFLAVPGAGQIKWDCVQSPFVRNPPGWGFPDGTVLVKTFSLDLASAGGATRRVETRLLHLEKLAPTDRIEDHVWRGYSYVWNEEQTDAELVAAGGLDRPFAVQDSRAPGGSRQQVWHFPSRAECNICHSIAAKFVLGVNTLQMNREVSHHGSAVNQLAHLAELGMFAAPLPADPAQLPRLVDYEDEGLDREARARSYLHANCAHCHTWLGSGNSFFELQANLPLANLKIVGETPTHGEFGLPDAQLIAPGRPESSVLYHRMRAHGEGRMPPVASSVVDDRGSELIADWIRSLPREGWQAQHVVLVAGLAAFVLFVGWRFIRRHRKQEPVSA